MPEYEVAELERLIDGQQVMLAAHRIGQRFHNPGGEMGERPMDAPA